LISTTPEAKKRKMEEFFTTVSGSAKKSASTKSARPSLANKKKLEDLEMKVRFYYPHMFLYSLKIFALNSGKRN